MDPKLRRKLIVSGTGVVVLIGLVVALYIFYLGPRLKVWREARQEITSREKRLEELRKAFGNQRNPQDEIRILEQEIQSLTAANQKLQKIKTIGTETESLPKELQDPDPAIRRELYKDYMKQVMEVAGNKLKEKLKNAQISPPDIKLYDDLQNADEVAYYMNRAGGLQGLTNALAQSKTPEGKLVIDELTLEDYATGNKRREGAVNIMSYLLKMTLDTQTLVSFLYNLHEQDAFYYIDHMEIKPRPTTRGASQEIGVEARINTTMIFKSQVQAQVKAMLAEAGKSVNSGGGGGGGWMQDLAMAMKRDMEAEKAKPKKKWYEFWKWFSK
jgi:hypothetical protein